MSLQIFKQNILSYMQNQQGISSYGDFAKKLTMEYDMAVKRGFDSVNSIPIGKGNTELMESTLNGIFATALQQSSGEHPIITNLGPAFIAYWTGATMSSVPPPIIPSPGAIMNIATVSSFITDPGIWQPTDTQSLNPPNPLPAAISVKSEPASEPEEEPIEEVLKRVPENNNTKEGAKALVEEVGVEVLTDDGEEPDEETQKLKQEFINDDEMMEVEEGAGATRVARRKYGDKDRDSNPKEESLVVGNAKSKNPECGTSDKLNYEEQLSPNFKLRHLTVDTLFGHRIKSQVGLSVRDITCNLKNLAINVLEPIKKKYPTMRINSAFRGTPSAGGKSQHMKGEAVDIQFPDIIEDEDYVPIAKWIAANLPFDQMIFEHGKSIWLHISLKRGGTQRKQFLTMWKGEYEPGLKIYRPRKKKK